MKMTSCDCQLSMLLVWLQPEICVVRSVSKKHSEQRTTYISFCYVLSLTPFFLSVTFLLSIIASSCIFCGVFHNVVVEKKSYKHCADYISYYHCMIT